MRLILYVVCIVLAFTFADGQVFGFGKRVYGSVKRAYRFGKEAIQGADDMWSAYSDMREANWVDSDKYFHARGNYDAAQRGPGGRWAAKVISNAREYWQSDVSGRGAADTAADQAANRWGRCGGDPDHYRPKGLPPKY